MYELQRYSAKKTDRCLVGNKRRQCLAYLRWHDRTFSSNQVGNSNTQGLGAIVGAITSANAEQISHGNSRRQQAKQHHSRAMLPSDEYSKASAKKIRKV